MRSKGLILASLISTFTCDAPTPTTPEATSAYQTIPYDTRKKVDEVTQLNSEQPELLLGIDISKDYKVKAKLGTKACRDWQEEYSKNPNWEYFIKGEECFVKSK